VASDYRYRVPTDRSAGDSAYTLAKSVLAAIPVAGGLSAEIFAAVVASPLAKRRDEWMGKVGEGLRRLEEGRNLTALSENDVFVDIVISVSTAAVRTASDSERVALTNAVLDAAVGRFLEDPMRATFVSLVDQFTDWHLTILKLIRYPEAYDHAYNVTSGSLAGLMESVYPGSTGQRQFYEQVWHDLYQRGLVRSDSDIIFSAHDRDLNRGFAKRTTELGDRFLDFITA
jgi:hypothetical protein